MQYFDTHCHLTLSEPTLDEHVHAAKAVGITYIFDPGLEINDLAIRTQTLKDYPQVLRGGAIAPHSHFQDQKLADALATLESYARVQQIHAIGEIGLEYFHFKDLKHQETQRKLLYDQLKLAKQYQLPVSLHLRSDSNRNAYTDAVSLLQDIQPTAPIISHCFVGNAEDATGMLASGAFISFSGILTFKSATALQDIAKNIPLDRILIETDAPFLTPVPMRGKKNISPYLLHTHKFLSALLQIAEDRLAEQLFKNSQTAFQLSTS